jgi:surface antigen
MKKIILVATLLPFALTACQVDKQQVGTIAGAAAGAAAGKAIGGSGSSGTIGLIVGALAGGYLGNQVGKWLDNKDREKINETTTKAAAAGKNGEVFYWANPDSGNRGSVAANETFASGSQTCRAVTQTVTTANGQSASGNGTVCKQADGTWRVVQG